VWVGSEVKVNRSTEEGALERNCPTELLRRIFDIHCLVLRRLKASNASGAGSGADLPETGRWYQLQQRRSTSECLRETMGGDAAGGRLRREGGRRSAPVLEDDAALKEFAGVR
jgi:hypothetical protein